MQQDRRTQNMQAVEWYDRDLLAEIEKLRAAIKKTIESNLHLADGDNCSLIELKQATMGLKLTGFLWIFGIT
jgi:hypothetical protein